MDRGNLDSEHSEDLMRPPPRAVRSKRKRGNSKGKAPVITEDYGGEEDIGIPPKKSCTEEALQKVSSGALSTAESCFIDDLKKESDLTDSGDLKTSTPNSAENLPQKRNRRGSTTGVDTSASASLSQLEVSCASDKSVTEEMSADDKSLELSGATDDSRLLERSGRRRKCTSARVLLGLEKRKSTEMTGQPKDKKEAPVEVMSADRKPSVRGPRAKQDVLPKVRHDVLSTSLEGLPDTPTSMSVERCNVVRPDWLKPFKLGWRREIVFRNAAKNLPGTKQLCDVYYFSSDDTKLRSLPQIIDYLKSIKSTLSGECFTFTKRSIYKEPQEMVRAAAFNRGRLANRTGLLSSNESSMKSFDEVNDDASSQASSTGTNRQRKLKETLASFESGKADVSIKTEAPVTHVVADSPVTSVKLDVKKEETSPDTGSVTALVEETDKRQAVRAAATLALRTYMSHALRTVNNPLLQSGNVKPPDKDKIVPSKSPSKAKSSPSQGKHRLSKRSLSPVVSMRRLNSKKAGDAGNRSQPEANIRRQKGPPSAMNLAKSNAKRSDESFSANKSHEPTTSSKVVNLKARSLGSASASPIIPGSADKSIRNLKKVSPLKKTSPLKKSTPKSSASSGSASAASFEKINAAIKELMSKKDGQPSVKKLSKSHQQATPLPAKAPSKSKTLITLPSPSVGKVLAKSDGKSNEKPTLSTEKKPALAPVPFVPKPVESGLYETSRICGMDCPGRLGIPPTLPCATCMCLFHPECAGYTSHMYFTPQTNFTCWACGKLNKELENTVYGLYKRESPTVEISSVEASSRKNQSAVAKSTSNGANSAGDTITLSSPTIHPRSSSNGSGDAVSEHHNVLYPSVGLSSVAADEVTVTIGPSAQLLVIPAALARHLNMSHPLTLLVDDREIRVKPEQLKVSGVGLNIMLPMGSVPDAFVEGPGKPLEFRVVSTAESGHQAVAVSLFERPLKLSSALDAFSAHKAAPTAVSKSDSIAQSDSEVTNSNKLDDIITSERTAGVLEPGKEELNLKSGSGGIKGYAKCDGSVLSDEAMGKVVAVEAVAECEKMDTNDTGEDLDSGKSEVEIVSSVSCGKMAETENMVSETEFNIPNGSQINPTEVNLSSSFETELDKIRISVEAPKTDVSLETECLFPITEPPVDSNSKMITPVACSTADESKENIRERETEEFATVVGNSCDEACERDGTAALTGNQLESTELSEEIESSTTTDEMSSTEVIVVEEAK